MDNALTADDWSLVQSFLAVAESGSLSAAARELGRSQPTLGRHIRALEDRLSLTLFDRHARGLSLSEDGARLLEPARRMRAAMAEIALAAAGQAKELRGAVRITASVFAAHHILPPILARIRQEEPAITLDLVPSDSSENLLFRAADIAVRMYRPTQDDIVTMKIGEIALAAFAAERYLERAGVPTRLEALFDHDLVGYDRETLMLDTMRSLGFDIAREDFAVRCDNQTVYWELVRAGCGIGFSQRSVGRADPLVRELPLEVPIQPLPVWLAAHQAMRHTPRIRRVWDLLANGLRSALAAPGP